MKAREIREMKLVIGEKENWAMMFSFFGTCLSYLIGAANNEIAGTLSVMILIDLLTGLIAARIGRKEKITSSKLFKTAAKFGIYFAIASVAWHIGSLLKIEALARGVFIYFVAFEGYSVLENAHNAGMPVPESLRNILKDRIEETKKE
jgi:toxin secretion/phage lysis holin